MFNGGSGGGGMVLSSPAASVAHASIPTVVSATAGAAEKCTLPGAAAAEAMGYFSEETLVWMWWGLILTAVVVLVCLLRNLNSLSLTIRHLGWCVFWWACWCLFRGHLDALKQLRDFRELLACDCAESWAGKTAAMIDILRERCPKAQEGVAVGLWNLTYDEFCARWGRSLPGWLDGWTIRVVVALVITGLLLTYNAAVQRREETRRDRGIIATILEALRPQPKTRMRQKW